MNEEIELKLSETFEAVDVEWSLSDFYVTSEGMLVVKALPFIKSSSIQDRLDDVVGKFNWKFNTRVEGGESDLLVSKKGQKRRKIEGFVGCLSIYDKDKNEWIGKEDGSEFTRRYAYKGGITGAFKRASSKWGIGRYLAKVGERTVVATFEAPDEEDLKFWRYKSLNFSNNDKENYRKVWWQEPSMPVEFLPLTDIAINESLELIEKAKTETELQSSWNLMPKRMQKRLKLKYLKKVKEIKNA